MNFLKGLKPMFFQDKNNQQNQQRPNNSQEKALSRRVSEQTKSSSSKSIRNQPDLTPMDAQNFMVSLRAINKQRQKQQNQTKCKINLFDKVQIEPIYLQVADETKLLKFQFQLGSDIFLDRTQHLYQQIAEINKVIKEVLSTRKLDTLVYFDSLKGLEEEVRQKIQIIQCKRQQIKDIRNHPVYQLARKFKRKQVLKQQIRLLKSVKSKNQAAFLQINNIDQAFATEQSRAKLYKKISSLSQLQKSKYVCTIKNKLISVSQNNRGMVQSKLSEWAEGSLSQKQVQKLTFMLYFICKSEIYLQNNIRIDFSSVNKQKLVLQIKKIFKWKTFTYVKDLMTKDKIHQFLNFLINTIADK